MKKIFGLGLVLILLIGFVNAEDPAMGGPIDILFQKLDNNTLAQERNTKIIQDTYGTLEESMMKWTPKITFGVSVAMLILYLTIVFFDRVRQKRGKPTYEQHIKDLEDTQRETIEKTNKVIENINNQLTPLISVLNEYEKKEVKKDNKQLLKGLWLGGFITFLFMTLLRLLGVL
jgi:hypothetical protein